MPGRTPVRIRVSVPVAKDGEKRMKEFLSEHWILLFALFVYAMGFLNGYLNGKRVERENK